MVRLCSLQVLNSNSSMLPDICNYCKCIITDLMPCWKHNKLLINNDFAIVIERLAECNATVKHSLITPQWVNLWRLSFISGRGGRELWLHRQWRQQRRADRVLRPVVRSLQEPGAQIQRAGREGEGTISHRTSSVKILLWIKAAFYLFCVQT